MSDQKATEGLLKAAGSGKIDAVKGAIQKGADLNAIDSRNLSAVHIAAFSGRGARTQSLKRH